jgi:tellurite resistance protein
MALRCAGRRVEPAARPHARAPLTTLAIPLGLAGLAQTWTVATSTLEWPFALAQGFWVVAALAWIWTAAAHVHRGARSEDSLSDQLTHMAHGPLAALLPISAMVLGAGLHRTYPAAGAAVTLVAIGAAAVFGAWISTFWMNGEMRLEAVHGGYYLPISAAGLVGALTASQTGLDWLAIGCFGVGLFFWLVISVFLFLRLALRPNMPDPLVPTLAIIVAPPAVAAAGWLSISGGVPDPLFEGLTALTAFLVLVQVPLLGRYHALRFTHGFWAFVFPAASVTSLAITWVRLEHPGTWHGLTVSLISVATLFVVVVAAKSLVLVASDNRRHAHSLRN